MKYAALCCIAKDEDLFLKEWLAYHSLIGFEHFIIYDNNSATPIAELLDGFAGPEHLTILRNTNEQSQFVAYAHCLERFGPLFRWIAFLDLDEFIRISPAHIPQVDVRDLLAEYEAYAGLGLNWRTFSSSGQENTPDGLVTEAYTDWFEDNLHIKSIVQPALVNGCAGPHSFYPLPGHHAVNADHFPIPRGFPATLPATAKACVNHYYFKSRECFERKIAKGNPCNILRKMEEFDQHLTMPVKKDASLLPFGPRLRQALAENRLPLPTPAPSPEPEAATSPATFFLAEARRELKAGSHAQAALCLCYAALHNDYEDAPDPLVSLEIWTLRAASARIQEHFTRAEYYVRQAFTFDASLQACTELANILLNTGRAAQSKQAVELIRGFPALQGESPS